MTAEPTTDPADLLRPLLDTADAHGHAMREPAYYDNGNLYGAGCMRKGCDAYADVVQVADCGEHLWIGDAWGTHEQCQGDRP